MKNKIPVINSILDSGKHNSGNTCDRLISLLPNIARKLIVDRPENENFRQNPDDPNEHVINWHQFGIITHTKFVLKSYQTEAEENLYKWNITRKINKKFQDKIDGKSKSELIEISIVLHDIGKFDRNFKELSGKLEYNFYGHEAMSEKLIKENSLIFSLLNETFGLTESQINYIARCAGLHFELGKVRGAAIKTNQGYSIAFSKSEECLNSCHEISSNFPEFREEIGILFLSDSLAKTDVRIFAETDEEIESKTQYIIQIIQERNLNPYLIAAIKQLPVSIAVARRYLGCL